MLSEIKQGLFKLDVIDYHAILGVPLDADTRQIRLRYLKIVPKLHPDTCKVKTEQDRELANSILAKLINPAYENLNKEKTTAEHLLLLSQKAKAIAKEGKKPILVTEKAKALTKTGSKLEQIYHKMILALAMEQYQDLKAIEAKIGEISEINLVYLIFKEIYKLEMKKQQGIPDSGILVSNIPKKSQQSTESENITGPITEGSKPKVSPLEACLKRAQEYKEHQKYKEAILEIRDALQIDPRNSSCHGLLGLIYLEQNSLSLAKVHIAKAWQTDPKDPIVIEAKEALDKLYKSKSNNTKQSNATKSGIFSNLFGNKKK